MPDNKQEQKIGSESTAIQAGGDVTIIQNNGLSAAEVKELCLQLLRENFPILRQEAIEEAERNVQKFATSLESQIIERAEEIIFEKFTDPDVQATINDAVKASARRGEKANPSLLVDLIIERASSSKNDFKDIVISEAVTVVPKITKPQIAYLSFIHYMTNMNVKGLEHISGLEPYSISVLSVVSEGFNLSSSQKRHLEYAGTCSIAHMMSVDIYSGWMNQLYKYMGYTNLEEFKSDISTFSPTSKILLDTFDKYSKKGEVRLTSVGQAIAIANLSTTIKKMDYSIWLK